MGARLIQAPTGCAIHDTSEKHRAEHAMKIAPSTIICPATFPLAGSANCGRNARKKINTLGLVTFMMAARR